MKQRDYALDLLRIVACVMVVVMHSPIPSADANGLLLSSLSYFTAPCIGLFFMVSGALILPPPIANDGCSALNFLRKRLHRVLMPTLVWTLFYIAVKWCDGDVALSGVCKSLLSMPFSAQGHGVLWFMYTLMGLYVVTPILQAWLRGASERDVRFYLLLWLITLCYPVLRMWVEVNDSATGILYYCSGYVGYFVLGYWLQRYGNQVSLRVASLLMGVSIAAPVVVKLLHWEVDFYSVFWYLSVFVAMQCVFWWQLMKRLQGMWHWADGVKRVITLISNLSFGIYLSHIFLMRHVVWKLPIVAQMHSQLLQMTVVALLTLVLSFVVSMLLGYTPLGNMVVGWRRK